MPFSLLFRMNSNGDESKARTEKILSRCRKLTLALGLLLIVSGLFFNLFSKDIVERLVKNDLRLTNSSKSYEVWTESPVPIFIDFYFFNWTNPSDLTRPGHMPVMQEVGPYRYRENIKKVDIIWNENGTVTYKKLRKWIFEPKGSAGSLDDVVTTLNVIALTAARTTKYWNRMLRMPLSATLTATQKMDIRKKVRELLFDGFADPLIEFASKVPGLSSKVPFDKFGWFYKRNESKEFDGVFNMETGENGLENLGKLRLWNHVNRTPFYEGRCGDVVGSAGEFWPPQRDKNEDVVLFSPDMCRYISFEFRREEIVGGLRGYRYESGPALFDNGTSDSKNKCFCAGDCYPSGTVNVSTCRFGAPAFVSYPHFFLADPSYLKSVSGMRPDPRKHEMYIVLDQIWGIPLEVAVRLQINLLIEPDPGIRYGHPGIFSNGTRMYKDVPRIFFPVMWFEQKVTMPEDMRSEIEFVLRLPDLGWAISVGFHVLGFAFVVAVLFYKEKKKELGIHRDVLEKCEKY